MFRARPSGRYNAVLSCPPQAVFDGSLTTVIEHNQGVKGNIMFFASKGGLERATVIYYLMCSCPFSAQ
jgi:hypothetical protein